MFKSMFGPFCVDSLLWITRNSSSADGQRLVIKSARIRDSKMRRSSRSSQGDSNYRYVHFNNGREGEMKFPGNSVNTYLYSIWNFWYKLAYEELVLKFPNAYFLVVSFFQVHSETTNTNGFPTTLPVVLLIVIVMSIMKLAEDAQRRKADHIANNEKTAILDVATGQLQPKTWVDIKVGDIVQVRNRQNIPADMLLVAAHEPEPNNPRGACSVETKSLDGETNLKEKSVPSVVRARLGGTLEAQLSNWRGVKGHAECEQPNASTQKFTGSLHIQDEEPMAVNINNVLLRGCCLRNTEYVLGLVVNTGIDTKVMQGARKPKARASSIEKSLNPLIIVVVILLIILCTIAAIARNSAASTLEDEAWYLDFDDGSDSTSFFWVVLRFFVLLNAFVSVSLMLSLYVCKSIQAWFMQQSLRMYHEDSDTPMKVRCMFLTDELGRISHVFSDKTGTLTQNIMQFRKCCIDGKAYGRGHTEIGLARLARLGQTVSEQSLHPDSLREESAANSGNTNAVNFEDPTLHKALKEDDPHGERCRQFFLLLALCHTVVIEELDGAKKLSASSPDEAALVAAAAFFGYEFAKRDNDQIYVTDVRNNKILTYTVLAVLEFSSARKRMSAILRDDNSGTIQILSKGADNVMLKMLASGQEELVRLTEATMKDHSNDGLRTLVLGKKDVDEDSYKRWHAEFVKACGSTTELEKKDREEPNEIDRLMGLVEQDLILLGSTAIEDKLQVGVPTAISDMSRAGIAVWVLTGDKEETAINIAFACQLLDTSTKITIINKKTHPTRARITEAFKKATSEAEVGAANGVDRHALVIDGDAIETVMMDKECKKEMLLFTQLCYSVVGCRCAPSQKAQLVELVRFNVKGATTLAIGDGANDVAMIQAAHCGVGISGQEGLQAANSADFSIAQFRFLVEMLLVHGRNNYRRMSTMVLYIFYKNMVLTLATFFYAVYSAWSAQKFYLEMTSTFFNVIWTFVPIIVTTIFDKDVDDETSRALPQMYHLGIRAAYYNPRVMLRWFIEAVVEALIILLVLVYSLEIVDPPEGSDPSVFYLGGFAFTMVLLVVAGKLLLWQWQVTIYQTLILFFFTIIWLPLAYISSLKTWINGTFAGFSTYPYFWGWTGLWQNVMDNPSFYLLCLLIPTMALLPQLWYMVWSRTFYPEFRDLAIETENLQGRGQAELAKIPIPASERRLPLVKDAPRSKDARRFFS
ncbi:hypothetical protein AB1Y20_008228 [Prymnesium parvum]|uniref:Phospholipid-transporting ATPase n=1 Tax=Prymnesium parvum TaxID=97485 RepID=A0AB34ITL4_PRYPA